MVPRASKFPNGSAVFSDDDSVENGISPPVRAQFGSRARSSHGARPFALAGHDPGEMPRQNRSANARLVGGKVVEAESSEELFSHFVDCFSRPISQASTRGHGGAKPQPVAVGSRDAMRSMATSLAASRRSRSSLAVREKLAPQRGVDSPSSLLLSQFLAPQRSLPNLPTSAGAGGNVVSSASSLSSGSERDASCSALSDSGTGHETATNVGKSNDWAGRNDWDWERASRDHLPQKVLALEQHQKDQATKLEALSQENLQLKRERVKGRAERAALENEISRLSHQIAQMAQAQINKEAELKEALGEQIKENEIGRARAGLGKGKSDAEFQRLKGMYATTAELKKTNNSKPVPPSIPGQYDPWAKDNVTTFEARDSMAEVSLAVKDFVSDVEKEQFVVRDTRETAWHFAHSLDLHRLAGHVDVWESQSANGDWDVLPPNVRKAIIGAQEKQKKRVDVEMHKDDGRAVKYNIDLQTMVATRSRQRSLRSRERTDVERAASILSAVASVRTGDPSSAESMLEAQ
eukprot:SAG31_NODE_4709_length_3018_cov_1.639603_1_plen_520_part_10